MQRYVTGKINKQRMTTKSRDGYKTYVRKIIYAQNVYKVGPIPKEKSKSIVTENVSSSKFKIISVYKKESVYLENKTQSFE